MIFNLSFTYLIKIQDKEFRILINTEGTIIIENHLSTNIILA